MGHTNHKPSIVRQIPAYLNRNQLNEDMDALIRLSIEQGASQAAMISPRDIVFDDEKRNRVNINNSYPSIHWPLKYLKDSIEDAVRAYQTGLFFQMSLDPDMPNYCGGPIPELKHWELYRNVSEIVTTVESAAFYMGYHLVIGFTSGNCRSIFCPEEKRCWATIRGKKCVQPYKGRPSLEAAGIDAFVISENLGFKLPIQKTDPLPAGLIMVV